MRGKHYNTHMWNTHTQKGLWWGVVAHACNSSILGGRGGQEFKTSLTNMAKPRLYYKYRIAWQVPVIPGTWEAEAGESLECRRQRLHWAEIMPLHSSWGSKSETPPQEKKRKKVKGMVALAYNPSSLEGWNRRIAWAQDFKTSLSNMANLSLWKI